VGKAARLRHSASKTRVKALVVPTTNRHGVEWFKALLAHEKPPEGQIWFAYMLKGGSDASNDDPFASEPPAGKLTEA